MALVTTFATTPLVSVLYPPWYQRKLGAWKRGEIDWDGNRLTPDSTIPEHGDPSLEKSESGQIQKLLVYLRLDNLPSLFTFVALLGGERSEPTAEKVHPSKANIDNLHTSPSNNLSRQNKPLQVHGLRMLELTERLSSVMKESEVDDFSIRDPVVNAFHTFGQLNNVAVSGEVQIVPEGSFADTLSGAASDYASDMVLLPWSENGRLIETAGHFLDPAQISFSSGPHNQFIATFLDTVPCNAAVFVNNGFGAVPRKEPKPLARVTTTLSLRSNQEAPTAPITDHSHHIFFPFFGGPDDRIALRFVLRLAQNSYVTATILHIIGPGSNEQSSHQNSHAVESSNSKEGNAVITRTSSEPSTSFSDDAERTFFAAIKDSLPRNLEPRVFFDTVDGPSSVAVAVERAKAEVGQNPRNAGDIVVVGRSGAGRAVISGSLEQALPNQINHSARACLGETAAAMISSSVKASVLIVQASREK